MTAYPLATILRGRTPAAPCLPGTADDTADGTADEVECYRTDDGQTLIFLTGAQPETAAALASSIDLRDPDVELCRRLEPITAPGAACGQDARTGFHAWITFTTTAEHQGSLAEFNVTATRSSLRHRSGFRSATFFLGRDRPTVAEHVVWESEAHYAAVAHTPEFAARHVRPAQDMATATTWQRLSPCPSD